MKHVERKIATLYNTQNMKREKNKEKKKENIKKEQQMEHQKRAEMRQAQDYHREELYKQVKFQNAVRKQQDQADKIMNQEYLKL